MILKTFDSQFFYEHSKGEFIMPSRHYHDLYEIYYLEKGRGNYFIDNKSYEIETGDIVFIPSGTVHKTVYEDNVRHRHVINCSGRYIPASVIEIFSGNSPVYRNHEVQDTVKEALGIIEREYNVGSTFSDDIIRCRFQLLLIYLAQNINNCVSMIPGNDLISDVAKFIKSNMENPPTLTETAKRFSLTPQYLSAFFKKKTGMRFHEYIHILRMLKAEELLTGKNNMRISEISEMCGFNDSNYFSFIFKKHFGMSPSKMRKTYSKK